MRLNHQDMDAKTSRKFSQLNKSYKMNMKLALASNYFKILINIFTFCQLLTPSQSRLLDFGAIP